MAAKGIKKVNQPNCKTLMIRIETRTGTTSTTPYRLIASIDPAVNRVGGLVSSRELLAIIAWGGRQSVNCPGAALLGTVAPC
jgi:hypothetical protein